MALCLPRKRRATSLATRPRTLSVASITNHSCVTSAGFALNVFMSLPWKEVGLAGPFPRSAFLWRESLRWGFRMLRRGATRSAAKPAIIRRSLASPGQRAGQSAAVTIDGMFSYRHAFHAGNHADVLKHTVLIATLEHLLAEGHRPDGGRHPRRRRPVPARRRLRRHQRRGRRRHPQAAAPRRRQAPAGIAASRSRRRIARLPGSGAPASIRRAARAVYPGLALHHPAPAARPRQAQAVRAAPDRFAHAGRPTSRSSRPAGRSRCCAKTASQRHASFLPPPSRRALVLCDPSYEIKSDYARVLDFVAEALKRFATGTYAVWYPIIPRPEAHDLPRRLKTWPPRPASPGCTPRYGQVEQDRDRRRAARRSGRACRPAACS